MAYLGEEIKKLGFGLIDFRRNQKVYRCGADQSHGGQIYGSRIYIF